MIITDQDGRWKNGRISEALECSKAARPARNLMTRRRLAARLQELVAEYLPDELDFFCDWLYGECSPEELWQRHIHATVETTRVQRGAQLRERTARVVRRLQKLAEDDAKCQILLTALEGFVRIVNNKPVEDEEIRH